MTPETSAAKAWLGRLALSDEEINRTFRLLATNLGTSELADAMRNYVRGTVDHAERAGLGHMLSVYGDAALSRVDFHEIAAGFQRIAERFSHDRITHPPEPFRRFR